MGALAAEMLLYFLVFKRTQAEVYRYTCHTVPIYSNDKNYDNASQMVPYNIFSCQDICKTTTAKKKKKILLGELINLLIKINETSL